MSFDLTAPVFERQRRLPEGVPDAIRSAILSLLPERRAPRILDIGAGTGRIGRAFVNAGDRYVGLDLSLGMLREFGAKDAVLLQADAEHLPFADYTFSAVLLIQVLSGARDWTRLLEEARRVLAEGAPLILGHTVTPKNGVDVQLKEHLYAILHRRGISPGENMQNRDRALQLLASTSKKCEHIIVASWSAARTSREFLERHRTGARFSALPVAVQQSALDELKSWAERRFGSLDRVLPEEHTFQLHAFTFGENGEN